MASPENQPPDKVAMGCKVIMWVLLLPWLVIIACSIGACVLGVF